MKVLWSALCLFSLTTLSAAPAGVGLQWLTLTPVAAWQEPGDNQSRLVRFGADKKLAYSADDIGGVIPDFSAAGYRGGGVALPAVPVKVTLSPEPDARDDRARIQAAIDQVAALPVDASGFRGAVLLRRGQYRIGGPLKITASGIVLRGESPAADGTVLIATLRKQHNVIEVGAARGEPRPIESTRRPLTVSIPSGQRVIPIPADAPFAVGDTVIIHRPSTAEWLAEIGMDRLTTVYKNRSLSNWSPGGFDMRFYRQIVARSESTVTLDAPLVHALEPRFGGGSIASYRDEVRIEQCGVEELRIVSEYDATKIAAPDELTRDYPIRRFSDEDHAWIGVRLDRVRDAWVRRVTVLHTGYGAVHCGALALRTTVQDCAMLDPVSRHSGGRKYSFGANGQLGLFLRCYSRHARHDFVLGARVIGPNAYVDCQTDASTNSSEPHHRYSVGCLWDNVHLRGGANLQVINRGDSGSGHGWSGASMVFWNSSARGIFVMRPPGAQNYAIGWVGPSDPEALGVADRYERELAWIKLRSRGEFRYEGLPIMGDAHIESPSAPVAPRSLYLQQLIDRLGPDAAAVVTQPTPGPSL